LAARGGNELAVPEARHTMPEDADPLVLLRRKEWASSFATLGVGVLSLVASVLLLTISRHKYPEILARSNQVEALSAKVTPAQNAPAAKGGD